MQEGRNVFVEIVQPTAEKFRVALRSKGYDPLPTDVSYEDEPLRAIPGYSDLLPFDFTGIRVPPPGSIRFIITINDSQSAILITADYWPKASLKKTMAVPFPEVSEQKIFEVLHSLLARWEK